MSNPSPKSNPSTAGAAEPHRVADRPTFVHLFLTWSCNLRCPQCFVSAGHGQPGEMDTLRLLTLADELVELRVRTVHVEGGEVTLRPDFLPVLERLSRLDDLLVVTNATRLDAATAEDLAAAGLRRVAVSLDGATAATHDQFRPGTFETIVEAIGHLQHAGLEVRVSTTLMEPNAHEAELLLDKCLAWGVTILNYDAFDMIGRGAEHPELRLSKGQWRRLGERLLPRAVEVADEMQVKVAIPSEHIPQLGLDPDDPHFEWLECTSGISQLAITPDGSVIPCFALVTLPELAVGNVKRESLAEIWRHSPRLDYYRTLTGDARCPMGYEGHLFFSNRRG